MLHGFAFDVALAFHVHSDHWCSSLEVDIIDEPIQTCLMCELVDERLNSQNVRGMTWNDKSEAICCSKSK